jgi:hypothetical protein
VTVIAVPKYGKLGQGFSKLELARDKEHPGRRTDGSQSAASWVGDLASGRKVVLLCSWCRGKFNPRKNGYRRLYTPDQSGRTSGYEANGMCDGCKQQTVLSPGGGTAYVSEETYNQVSQDPAEARRKARAKWR